MFKFNLKKFLDYRRVLYAIKDAMIMTIIIKGFLYLKENNIPYENVLFHKALPITFIIAFVGSMFTYPKPLER